MPGTPAPEPAAAAARCPGMVLRRLFGLYLIVELVAVAVLVRVIGFGPTVLVLLATFLAGLLLAGAQVKRHLRRLRAGLAGAGAPAGAAADGLLVALGGVLVLLPGPVSSVLGALLLVGPTRAVLRPVAVGLVARRMPLVTAATGYGGAFRARRADYIDGEVVDVDTGFDSGLDTDPPRLPRRPD